MTPRLILRDFLPDDAERLAEYFSEREAQAHILRGQRHPGRTLSYVRMMARYAQEVPLASRSRLAWAIALRDTHELVGMCSLSNAHAGSSRACIGWHLSHKFSGFGYATEAAREVMRFAFEERRVARLYADCYEANAANRRVFAKLGLQPSPCLALLKWFLAVRYMEPKPIVRYRIENQYLGSAAVAA